jgi:asparagine synthase (glutamine-hydrolysing)
VRSLAVAIDADPGGAGSFTKAVNRLRYNPRETGVFPEFAPFRVGYNRLDGDPVDSNGGCCVDGDMLVLLLGRLDNRVEIAAALHAAGRRRDPELVLGAFRRWGAGCFERFRGPMVAVVLDRTARSVILYRDPLGVKTLFYAESARGFTAASQPEPLPHLAGLAREPEPEWLARYFGVSRIRDNLTAYRHVRELLPGQVLTFDSGGARVARHPAGFGNTPIRYRRLKEYADHYWSLLEQAVERALVGVETPAVMLSGGVDSPGIAATLIHGRNGRDGVRAYSWSLEELPEADESRWIRSSAAFLGIDLKLLPASGSWPGSDLETWPVTLNTPSANAYERLKAVVYDAAGKDGVRVLLNGAFADRLYPHRSLPLRSMVMDGRYREFFREGLRTLAEKGPAGSFRDPAIRGLGRLVLPRRPAAQETPRPWLTDFAHRVCDAGDRWPPELEGGALPDQYEGLFGINCSRGTAGAEPFSLPFDIEVRDPYSDADLVDFMLSVPAHVFYRQGYTKYIARLAQKGRVPEEVRTKPRTGLLTPFFDLGIDRAMPRIRDLLVRDDTDLFRYIDRGWLSRVLDSGDRSDTEGLMVWMAVTYQLWLNRLEAET